jgi:predicted secreted Zn-dependent protease
MSDGLRGEPVWRKGLPCESGACVEVAAAGDAVMVRSSANPAGAPVTLSRDEWQNFLAGVKAGAFDRV